MSGLLGRFMGALQQAPALAQKAKDYKNRKTSDGRRVLKIACLGHARSGKTAFWTVLHEATRDHPDTFSLQTGDHATAAYLIRQHEAMQQGAFHIPPPGEKPAPYEPGYPGETGEVQELLFLAREAGGKEYPVLVLDYPGKSIGVQDASGGYAEVAEFVKAADGALFFVDALTTRTSPQGLQQQLLAYNSLLKQLEDKSGRINKPVGLVITKADLFEEFRPVNPTEILSGGDQARRGAAFSRWVADHLKADVYNKDAAWRIRMEKTFTRIGSFQDALLKKCRATQTFLVSAVGDRHRRPIEPGDAQASIAGSMASSFVVGKNQVGMEAPLRWLLKDISIMQTVHQAGQWRNRALGAAAMWVVLVSLPFLAYLGCAVKAIEKDLVTTPLPTVKTLKDLHGFQDNLFVRLWTHITPGYMPTVSSVQARIADRVAIVGKRRFVEILNTASGNTGDQASKEACQRLSEYLEKCLKNLPDTTGPYKSSVLDARCVKALSDQCIRNFDLARPEERQRAFLDLDKTPGGGGCVAGDILQASTDLAGRVGGGVTASGGGGGGGGGAIVGIKDAYNQIVGAYGQGTKPESRLNTKLISDLKDLLNKPRAVDPGSQQAAQRARAFLAAVAPFENGVTVRIQLLQLSSPATVKIALPGAREVGDHEYGEGDAAVLPNWKLGTEVRMLFLLKDYSSTPYILDAPDGLVKNVKQPISIAMQSIRGGQPRTVLFQYEIESPQITDQTVPPLNPIP